MRGANPAGYEYVQIFVKQGTYYPDRGAQETAGNRGHSFGLKEKVRIYGGFDGSESELEERDYLNNVTILSGDIYENDNVSCTSDAQCNTLTGACFQGFCTGDNSIHVVDTGVFGSNPVDDTAILDGFTVRAGHADGSDFDSHGGTIGGQHT